jgi:hypothetical protein
MKQWLIFWENGAVTALTAPTSREACLLAAALTADERAERGAVLAVKELES